MPGGESTNRKGRTEAELKVMNRVVPDHITPSADGGTDLENLQPLCHSLKDATGCNIKAALHDTDRRFDLDPIPCRVSQAAPPFRRRLAILGNPARQIQPWMSWVTDTLSAHPTHPVTFPRPIPLAALAFL